jgi:hypothetical protein
MFSSSLLAIIEISLAAIVSIALVFVSAPYGRHFRPGWGASLPARWGWMIMEFPAWVVIGSVVLSQAKTIPLTTTLLLALWLTHYFYRVFIYPFLLTSPNKPFPLLLVGFAIAFNVLNASANGLGLVEQAKSNAAPELFAGRFIAGALLFAAGFLLHVFSDRHLRALRRQSRTEYQLPQSPLFSLVSSPNYLGEIVEWCGWAIAAWSPAALAFALFTIANLAPRAWSNHTWYRTAFPEYPKNRRALIPWVW